MCMVAGVWLILTRALKVQTSIVEKFLRISDSNVMANILGIFDFISNR